MVPVDDLGVMKKLLGPSNMDFREGLPDVPRTRMEHDPDVLLPVEADLDEVIPAPQRPHLLAGLPPEFVNFPYERVETLPKAGLLRVLRDFIVPVEPHRDRLLDAMAKELEIVR